MWKLVCECNKCGAMVYGTEKRAILDDTRNRGWQTKNEAEGCLSHLCDVCKPVKVAKRRCKSKEEKIAQLRLQLEELVGCSEVDQFTANARLGDDNSKEACDEYRKGMSDANKPLSPEVLVSALQDSVHEATFPVGRQPLAAIEEKGFDVAKMAEIGMSTKEISAKTGLSERTIRRMKSKSTPSLTADVN